MHFYTIQVHRATGLAKRDEVTGRSALYCVVVVQSGAVSKPWKGGGRTSCIESTQNPAWAEAFLVEESFCMQRVVYNLLFTLLPFIEPPAAYLVIMHVECHPEPVASAHGCHG